MEVGVGSGVDETVGSGVNVAVRMETGVSSGIPVGSSASGKVFSVSGAAEGSSVGVLFH